MDRRKADCDVGKTMTAAAAAATTTTLQKTARPTSAPKPTNNVAPIPRIVLDDRGGVCSDNNTTVRPSPMTIPTITTNVVNATSSYNGPGPGVQGEASTDQGVPFRCNSDIGLPACSPAPSLTMAMTLGENGGGDKLGVYCSPRTTRRSVDLDLGSRDPCRDYDWLEDRTSSLRVLSAGSRVGSAISLNSVCTAHSVGLLSNDSSEDFQDSSLHDGSVSGGVVPQQSLQGERERSGPLRRLQSYPEEDKVDSGESGVTPRTSHSLCNLRDVQASREPHHEQLTPEKLCLLPSDLDECDDRMLPPEGGREKRSDGRGGGGGGEGSGVVGVARRKGARGEDGAGEDNNRSYMVSYGKGSNSMREGRIRRWLEDMGKASE